MRSKLLKLNTFTSLLYQVVVIVCSFILPRQILGVFGSDTNGLVNSITQFLQFIGLLELGVGAVVESSLYKPLADRDYVTISKVMSSGQKFFNSIARILLGYVALLCAVYPLLAHQDYGWMYTALLIVAISISSFAQYYFGIVNSILIRADQHGYVQYTIQTVTIVLNTVACVLLIRLGASIHIVKLTTSLIFLLRPLVLLMYVNRHYAINRKIQYEGEPIKQKWNGIAQHVAAVVLDGTDNVVLTIFSTLANVSIYSVYHLVIYGVKNLFMSLTNGIQSLIGELWAKQELELLNNTFGWFEWVLHTGTVFVFGCTGMLLLPFVSVYTAGVTDANYIQPLFAVLLTMANAGHCLRLPYSVMILAGGHYQQTQHSYIIAAVMNVVLSVVLVIRFGLIGVAIGTLTAMIYQTVWMAWYVSKNLNHWPFHRFIKQMVVDMLSIVIATVASRWITLVSISYASWILMAVKVVLIWIAVIIPINIVFYRYYVVKSILVCKEKVVMFFRKWRGMHK